MNPRIPSEAELRRGRSMMSLCVAGNPWLISSTLFRRFRIVANARDAAVSPVIAAAVFRSSMNLTRSSAACPMREKVEVSGSACVRSSQGRPLLGRSSAPGPNAALGVAVSPRGPNLSIASMSRSLSDEKSARVPPDVVMTAAKSAGPNFWTARRATDLAIARRRAENANCTSSNTISRIRPASGRSFDAKADPERFAGAVVGWSGPSGRSTGRTTSWPQARRLRTLQNLPGAVHERAPRTCASPQRRLR